MRFVCDCKFHILDIDKRPISFKNDYKEDYLGITIYGHRSENTGKLFKKPKELGTVVLIGEEARKFIRYIKMIKLT